MSVENCLAQLDQIRQQAGEAAVSGLSIEVIREFLSKDSWLAEAIAAGSQRYPELINEFPDLRTESEKSMCSRLQEGILNFYPPETVSPYIPLAAKGPWIVTCYGSVIYDTGGYGMLGLGHDPAHIRSMLSRPYTMANVMTPSFCQRRLVDLLQNRIGKGECPYAQFVCMNSGSEACGVATRISSALAKKLTDPGGRHAGKQIRLLSLEGSFHGRTLRPAQASDSTRKTYKALALFRDNDDLLTVAPNDSEALQAVFKRADEENFYIEFMLMEPVQGEGNPGMAIAPEFYSTARELTRQHGSMLIVDSIQAGLRAHGVLSIIDYPGFENCDPPDMEAFSKALNAGQFPLSVLALTAEAASHYVTGTYGNTMTSNPRALDIACAVLNSVDDALTSNIRERGDEFVAKLELLREELGGVITQVQGTGLLVAAAINPEIRVVGNDGVEVRLRKAGVNVIHGGENALRFTPHFGVTSREIDLIVSLTGQVLKSFADS